MPQESTTRRVLHDFGYFGHFMHVNAGGRGGKQYVLVVLAKHDGRMTQRSLQEVVRISSPALSEVLAKLENEGLVERARCEQDRRAQEITLTPEGAERAEQVMRKRAAFETEALDCLTSEEAAQLADLLDRVAAHWQTFEPKEA